MTPSPDAVRAIIAKYDAGELVPDEPSMWRLVSVARAWLAQHEAARAQDAECIDIALGAFYRGESLDDIGDLDAARKDMRAALDAALAVRPMGAAPSDWRLMPEEPTEAALDAMVQDTRATLSYDDARDIYSALHGALFATPPSPASGPALADAWRAGAEAMRDQCDPGSAPPHTVARAMSDRSAQIAKIISDAPNRDEVELIAQRIEAEIIAPALDAASEAFNRVLAVAHDVETRLAAVEATARDLKAELHAYQDAARYYETFWGAKFSHWDDVALNRARALTEARLAREERDRASDVVIARSTTQDTEGGA